MDYKAPESHEATVEDRYSTTLKIKDKEYSVDVLDTAGEEDFQNLLDMWVNFADGILLVFAVNERESLEIAKNKRERILKSKGALNKMPIFLVGNKLDKDKREVFFDEAENKASFYGIEYFEISCKYNLNIPEIYARMITQCIPNISNIPLQNSFKINTVNVKKKKKDNKICC